MNRTQTLCLVVLLTCLMPPCPAATAATPPKQSLANEFDDWFHQQVREDKVLGAAFAVVSREGIIRIGTAGYTDTHRKQAINPDTAFRIASVSKTFAAELTAQMVQDGHLSWNDPVTM